MTIQVFHTVRSTDTATDFEWEVQDGETFMDVLLELISEVTLLHATQGRKGSMKGLSSGLHIRRIEDGTHVGSNKRFERFAGYEGSGVVLKVELAALPRDTCKSLSKRTADAAMVITRHAKGTIHPASNEGEDERLPMLRSFRGANRDSEDHFLSGTFADACGYESSAIANVPLAAYL